MTAVRAGGMADRRGRLDALLRVPHCGVLWRLLCSPACCLLRSLAWACFVFCIRVLLSPAFRLSALFFGLLPALLSHLRSLLLRARLNFYTLPSAEC